MEILYSDDRVIVCIKPPGVPSTDMPGGMPELLRREIGGSSAAIKSVHRLDLVVGGVMVYARTRHSASDLSGQITDGRFRKGYLAVVKGMKEKERGTLRDMLLRDRRERKTYIVPEGTDGAQEAVLDYECVKEADGLSLMAVRLYTGRTHQIRCQLAGHGFPILGDMKYAAPADECGIALWSHRLEFFHPRTGERMCFLHDPPQNYPWTRFFAENCVEKYTEKSSLWMNDIQL